MTTFLSPSCVPTSRVFSQMEEPCSIPASTNQHPISWPKNILFSDQFQSLLASKCLDAHSSHVSTSEPVIAGYVTLPKGCSRNDISQHFMSLSIPGLKLGSFAQFCSWYIAIGRTDISVVCLSRHCSDVHPVINCFKGGPDFDTVLFGQHDIIPQECKVFVVCTRPTR